MKFIFNPEYLPQKQEILALIDGFDTRGKECGDSSRNQIKKFELDNGKVVIKSFKVPNLINKVAYKYFRKSKAQRSFEYANILLKNGVGTPEPVAFAEEIKGGMLTKSFYICELLEYQLTFRDLDLSKKGHEEILRAFTRFTYFLHENEIEFLDHSPGNTLIKLKNGQPEFFLVDLNRMNFKHLNYQDRMKNFARLAQDVEIFKVMANEYALKINRPEKDVLQKMLYFNRLFFEKRTKKRRLKNKFRKLIGIND